MTKVTQPLAEVFGHSPNDFSERADRYRIRKLCPFNNKVPSCTKDKAKNPLGVCSVNYNDQPVITCPIRFREDWLITDDAADFFFDEGANWTSLTEVRLVDYYGKSAGNIDVVLVAYDENGKVYDFGSLEIQAVYISGNVRDPFAYFMSDCRKNADMDWSSQPNFPRPDFLSSSRKRLAPQMLYKGGILNEWNKKMAVAMDSSFFNTLPKLNEVKKSEAEVAWLVYDLVDNSSKTGFSLKKTKIIYTKFIESLNIITKPRVGDIKKFINVLQEKVDEKLEAEPINKTIDNPFESQP
ncbi:hypothetical protein AB835_11095 [Candidatus Endobugula sertula]|uniref:Restriction endonuclease type II NotI domain-containing protein n=1 Tax=Candidatus Endobugula sertula TaxID=62101 RepID=A0A1D2QN73_9GAMM|nr:hypothetical protein AB835_11095 [Candidatus Endobugula sertula]